MNFYKTIVFLSLIAGNALADEVVSSKIKPNGITRFDYKGALTKIQVEITTHEVFDDKDGNNLPACTGSRNPCIIMDKLKIMVNKYNVFVPVSSYLDLSDVFRAELRKKNKNMQLIVYGGDAAESYISHLYFNDNRIKKKMTTSSILPNEPAEVANYYIPVVKD